jgi:hypothetical protein
VSDTFLYLNIKIPVPSSRMEQAKTLVSIVEPVDTLKSYLPPGSTIEDKIITVRGPSTKARKSPAAKAA